MTWRNFARCAGYPTGWWFAYPGTPEHDQALALCRACPVIADCALAGRGERGLWAGCWHGARRSDRAELELDVREFERVVHDCELYWSDLSERVG